MDQLMMMIAGFTDTINEAMPQLIERLPAAQVQKFRDMVQAMEAAQTQQGLDVTLEDDAQTVSLPEYLGIIMDLCAAELKRRAEFEERQAAQIERIAAALEKLAA